MNGMLNRAETTNRNNQYLQIVRKSYGILCHAAAALEASCSTNGDDGHYRDCAATVHSLVDRLVWADRRMVLSECTAMDALLDEDRRYVGALNRLVGKVPVDEELLKQVPPFVKACRAYDMAHDTRLEPTVVNALDTMGMSLLAVDREIAEEEFMTLREVLGPCYRYLETRIPR